MKKVLWSAFLAVALYSASGGMGGDAQLMVIQ